MLADLLELAKMEARLISLQEETALSCNDAAWGLLLRQPDACVELSQRQQAGVGAERGVGHLDLDGQRLEKVEMKQRSR
jgi:hypothetical protein